MEGLINIAKFVFVIFALPVVIAMTGSFNHVLDKFSYFSFEFKIGIMAYVITHFFIFPFKVVYNAGQKITEPLFSFSKAFARTLPLFLPFFAIIFLMVFWLAKENHWRSQPVWAFVAGLAFAMHLILTAQSLQDEDSSAVKPHYFFLMTWVYVANLSLVVVLLSFVSESISLKDFFVTTMIKSKDIYLVLFRHLL